MRIRDGKNTDPDPQHWILIWATAHAWRAGGTRPEVLNGGEEEGTAEALFLNGTPSRLLGDPDWNKIREKENMFTKIEINRPSPCSHAGGGGGGGGQAILSL